MRVQKGNCSCHALCQEKTTRSSRAPWQVRTLQGLLLGAASVVLPRVTMSGHLVSSCRIRGVGCVLPLPMTCCSTESFSGSLLIHASPRCSACSFTKQSISLVSREILLRCRELSSARLIRTHHLPRHFCHCSLSSSACCNPTGRRLSRHDFVKDSFCHPS